MSPARRLLVLAPIALALAGCAGGEDVSTRSIANARRTWEAARVRNYDLEWTSSGARDGHYLVTVRGGQVLSIKSIVRDRRTGEAREVEARPGDKSYYGVEGLFKVLEEERAQLDQPEPFGRPRGASTLLRFTPDPKFGYPSRYRRDVAGSPRGLAIDVVRFVPNPSAPAPAPVSTPAPPSSR